MNKNAYIGFALIAAAAAIACLTPTSAGSLAARFVGKAVWYLPYAALVSGFRFLARA